MGVEDVKEWLDAVREDIELSLDHREKVQDNHVKFSSAIVAELESMNLSRLAENPDFFE